MKTGLLFAENFDKKCFTKFRVDYFRKQKFLETKKGHYISRNFVWIRPQMGRRKEGGENKWLGKRG